MSENLRTPLRLTMGVAALMAAQSVLGLVFQDLYRDVAWIKATWFGNDWLTLVLAVPLLLAGAALARKGSVTGLLLWLGMLAFAIYNYAFYLFGAALNAFFPLYVLAVVLATVALVSGLARIDVRTVAAAFRAKAPVRLIGGYYVFVAVGLAVVWFGTWAAYAFAGRPTPVAPEAFKLVAALDTTMMVPALLIGGVLLWRRQAWGYVVAAIAGVQASLYLILLSLNSIIAIQRGLAKAPGELPIWGTLGLLTLIATVVLLANSGGERTGG